MNERQSFRRHVSGKGWRRLMAALLAVVVPLTGCGESADDATATTTVSPAPAADGPADADPSDSGDEPATTTTAATTTSSTTSAPPVPANGVVVASDGLLGWVDDGAWRATDEPGNPVAAGLTYRIVGIGEQLGTAEGSAPGPGCFDGIETVEVGLDVDSWPNDAPIAVSGGWDLFPHSVQSLGLENSTYVDATRELLSSYGIDDESPQLVQLIRLDLEGDGVDEVIVVAERNASGVLSFPALGDYGVAYLRRLIDGEVHEALLGGSFIVDDPAQLLLLLLCL